MPRTMNTLLLQLKKNTLEDIQCSFQIDHFHCKYFCETFLFDLPYIKKLLSKSAYMLLFIESKWCEEQFCVIFELCFVYSFSHIRDVTYLK